MLFLLGLAFATPTDIADSPAPVEAPLVARPASSAPVEVAPMTPLAVEPSFCLETSCALT